MRFSRNVVVSTSASSQPASFVGLHSTAIADVESSPEDFFEVSIDNDVTGKEVAVRPVDLQTYKREEVWLTIFQFSEVYTLVHAVRQKCEDDLLESLQANKYKYSAGLTTVADPAPGELGAVNVDIMR